MRFPAFTAAAVGLAVALSLLPITNRERLRSTDFVNFYTGASIVARGDGANLYNPKVQAPELRSFSGLPLTEYFLHPPFEAAILAPLALLPFQVAYVIWTAINAALVAGLYWPFAESIPMVRRVPLLGMAGFVFFPVGVSLVLGQDSVILLAILAAGYALLRRRPVVAGLVFSLAAIKFQYLVFLGALLLLAGKRRSVLGIALGSAVLLVISAAVLGPRGLASYVALLRDFSAHSGYGSLHWDLMVNLRGFLAGLRVNSRAAFITGECALAALALICACKRGDEPMQFSVFVTASLLLSPYSHFADSTVLLLPALLLIDRAKTLSRPAIPFAATIALFLVPLGLLAVGGHYWWNSRIYLMFPVILLFLLVLITEFWRSAATSLPTSAGGAQYTSKSCAETT